jgi:hypothetical protein
MSPTKNPRTTCELEEAPYVLVGLMKIVDVMAVVSNTVLVVMAVLVRVLVNARVLLLETVRTQGVAVDAVT